MIRALVILAAIAACSDPKPEFSMSMPESALVGFPDGCAHYDFAIEWGRAYAESPKETCAPTDGCFGVPKCKTYDLYLRLPW